MKKTFIAVSFLSLFSFALVANAQVIPFTEGVDVPDSGSSVTGFSSCSSITSGFSNVISCALAIINSVIPIIIALMIVWVTWSAFNMTRVEGEKRDEYRNSILYGIVAIFVAVSIYGLVAILTNTFFSGGPSNSIKVVNTTTSITQQ